MYNYGWHVNCTLHEKGNLREQFAYSTYTWGNTSKHGYGRSVTRACTMQWNHIYYETEQTNTYKQITYLSEQLNIWFI